MHILHCTHVESVKEVKNVVDHGKYGTAHEFSYYEETVACCKCGKTRTNKVYSAFKLSSEARDIILTEVLLRNGN